MYQALLRQPWGIQNGYIIVLHMTEDGTKVEKFEEFVDSKPSVDFALGIQV